MKLFRLKIMLLLVIIFSNPIFIASETVSESSPRFDAAKTLEDSVEKAVEDTNFNGSIMITQNDGDQYNTLYEGAAGSDGGYNIDTLYDIGSVSKLYTATAVLMLEESGELSLSDPISKYLDNVPSDKSDVTVAMLLNHTSGIYANENSNRNVTKEQELKRVLTTKLNFKPGTNYKYSNAGFTLLAAIVESASGLEFETYLTANIFEPLGLLNTGFPDSEYLKDNPAVSGTLNKKSYGPVNQFDYGWYSKGYTDVVSTPREITYFFQALISGELVSSDSLDKMADADVKISADSYRGAGTEIASASNNKKTIGHSGVWYGGNTAVYYRPSDGILFVLACDELVVNQDLPAIYVYNSLRGMYPPGTLDDSSPLSTMAISKVDLGQKPVFDITVKNQNSGVNFDPYSKNDTFATAIADLTAIFDYTVSNTVILAMVIGIIVIALILIYLSYKRYKYLINLEKGISKYT